MLQALSQCKERSLLSEEDTSLIVVDYDAMRQKMQKVKEAFGPDAEHTVAIKTNPLTAVLNKIVGFGFGLEAASFEEVIHANSVNSELILWDSPVKTKAELLKSRNIKGLVINANSLSQLDLILSLKDLSNKISLRINPVLQTGSHETMSVSGLHSKFGEPILNKRKIIESIANQPAKVDELHVHSSSQNTDYQSMVMAVKLVVDLANEINNRYPGTIRYINIGGGFPVDYMDYKRHNIEDYASMLRCKCPELFDGTYTLRTEFGRYYHAYAAFTLSRIEDVFVSTGHQTIVSHIGADSFLRESYNPNIWNHQFAIVRNNEIVESNNCVNTDLGGPLCFGGDYIAKSQLLPIAKVGDWLLIKDTGANTFSLWSKHCSRAFPKVIGIEGRKVSVIKHRQRILDSINFWS